MDETPIFASVERDLHVTYADLADSTTGPAVVAASGTPGVAGAAVR